MAHVHTRYPICLQQLGLSEQAVTALKAPEEAG